MDNIVTRSAIVNNAEGALGSHTLAVLKKKKHKLKRPSKRIPGIATRFMSLVTLRGFLGAKFTRNKETTYLKAFVHSGAQHCAAYAHSLEAAYEKNIAPMIRENASLCELSINGGNAIDHLTHPNPCDTKSTYYRRQYYANNSIIYLKKLQSAISQRIAENNAAIESYGRIIKSYQEAGAAKTCAYLCAYLKGAAKAGISVDIDDSEIKAIVANSYKTSETRE